MPVIALVSAKGSPGVTTAAAALTAAATLAGDSLLVELDPSGGDVQILTGVEDEPGVVLAATELRRQVGSRAVEAHVSITPPGVPALLAPTAELMASSVIASVSDRWRPALREYGGTVVVDAGRWDAAQATARRAAIGDVVAVVCRPSVASVEHARHIVDRLRTTARRPVVALVIGTRPYAPSEVAAELEVPLGGAIAWDPRGVGTLWSKGMSKSWGRTWLAASAAQSLESLLDLVPDAIAQGPVSRSPGTGRRPLVAPADVEADAGAEARSPAGVATSPPGDAEPEAEGPGGTEPDEPPPARPQAGAGSQEGPEPSGRPGGDAPPDTPPGPAPTEADGRTGASTGHAPPFPPPPPPPPPPAVPADEAGGRPPVPPPPVPAHRSSAAGPVTPAARAVAAAPIPVTAAAAAPNAPVTAAAAAAPNAPVTAAAAAPNAPATAADGGSVAVADGAERAERTEGAGHDPATTAAAEPPERAADGGRATPEAPATPGDQVPLTSFERFTLGRARQRARHAERAIATAQQAGPDEAGPAPEVSDPGGPRIDNTRIGGGRFGGEHPGNSRIGGARAGDPRSGDARVDSAPDLGEQGPGGPRGPGAASAAPGASGPNAEHSPPVRRGRRLNYGLARRDRS